MDVNGRDGLLYRARQLNVEIALHVGRQTGLHADFGCAHVRSFLNAAQNFFHR